MCEANIIHVGSTCLGQRHKGRCLISHHRRPQTWDQIKLDAVPTQPPTTTSLTVTLRKDLAKSQAAT